MTSFGAYPGATPLPPVPVKQIGPSPAHVIPKVPVPSSPSIAAPLRGSFANNAAYGSRGGAKAGGSSSKPSKPSGSSKGSSSPPKQIGSPQVQKQSSVPAARAASVLGGGNASANAASLPAQNLPGVAPGGTGIAANSPLLNPGTPLTGSALYQAAEGLAAAQYMPAYNALAASIAQNDRQTKAAEKLTAGYFTQLGAQALAGTNQEKQIGQDLNSQLAGISGGENQTLQQLGQGQLGMLRQYAPGDQSLVAPAVGALSTEIARQQGLAAQGQGAFRAAGAVQGANYRDYAASNRGTFALAGQEALKNIVQGGEVRNQPLTEKQAALAQNYGATLAADLGKLRQQEITNRFTGQGLGLKGAALKITAANDAARNALTAQRNRTSLLSVKVRAQQYAAENALKAAGLAITKQNDLANQQIRAAYDAARAGKTGILTPNENNRMNEEINRAAEQIQYLRTHGIPGNTAKGIKAVTNPTDVQLRTVLGSGAITDAQLQAAFELVNTGVLTSDTAALLHRMGMRGGSYNGAPIRVARVGGAVQGAGAGAGSLGSGWGG